MYCLSSLASSLALWLNALHLKGHWCGFQVWILLRERSQLLCRSDQHVGRGRLVAADEDSIEILRCRHCRFWPCQPTHPFEFGVWKTPEPGPEKQLWIECHRNAGFSSDMAKLGFLSLTMSKHLKGLAGYVSLTSAGRRFVGILSTGPTECANDESSFETAKSKNACPKHPHGHMYVQFLKRHCEFHNPSSPWPLTFLASGILTSHAENNTIRLGSASSTAVCSWCVPLPARIVSSVHTHRRILPCAAGTRDLASAFKYSIIFLYHWYWLLIPNSPTISP